jgi:hypothetical protein
LALLSPRPKRSVLFVFWDAEEKGLLGSKHWIAQPTLPPARVVQVVNVDMIGRLRGEHLILVGNRTRCGLRRLASELNEGGRLKIEFPWEIKANADHYPFYDHHIPAITVHTGEHEDYHRPSDKSNRINRDGMQQVGRFLLDMVYELANRPLLAGYREAARREAGSSEKTLIESTSKPPDRLGATWQTLDEATPGPVLLGIVPGAPADKAQLRRGDRVVSVAGREVRSDSELERQLQIAQGPVEIVVRRYGQAEPLKRKVELEGSPMRVGISWRVDDAEPGTIVLSYVLADSPAARAGLAAGDRIYQVGGHNFRDEQEFAKLLEGGPRPLDLLVERDGRLRHAIIQWTADALRRAA